jgi:phytanoyl-CoA hydroxylase
MPPMPIATYEDHHHQHFEKHGYVSLGQLITDSELAALRECIDALMLGEIETEGITFQLDGENGEYGSISGRTVGPSEKTLAYRRIDELHHDPLFLTYMQHPLFRQITARYVGEDVSIFRSMFMNKPASRGTILPWHQDIGTGWGLDTNPFATVWTALDDATPETGCMQIVPGSHQLGILNEGHYTSEEDQAAHCTDDKVVHLEARAGEAILIHNWLLHRSGVNSTTQPRRAFSAAYMDARSKNVKTGETFPIIFGRNALRPRSAA